MADAFEEPCVTLEAFLMQDNATAVRLEAGDDARALLPHLARLLLVEVAFPTFRDGRGYSAARVLREAGYRGTLRAQGDVLVDQVPLMRRCGFDAFAPENPIDDAALARAETRYRAVYQRVADARTPIWRCGMASAARVLDTIDVRPAFTAADALAFEGRFAGVSTQAMLAELLSGELAGRIAAVSSFGTESAVLLHMIASIDRDVPVIFTNTQKMFGATLAYRDELAERLGFTDLRVYRPDPRLLAAKDATGLRWSYDPDGCCDLRKVEPLGRALEPFEAWISGRKGFQSGTRRALPRFEEEAGRLKLNPLADWDRATLNAYFAEHDLPRHPLESDGYASIGCSPCTSKVKPGEDPRAGRWRGWDKTECGIHTPVGDGDPEQPSF